MFNGQNLSFNYHQILSKYKPFLFIYVFVLKEYTNFISVLHENLTKINVFHHAMQPQNCDFNPYVISDEVLINF